MKKFLFILVLMISLLFLLSACSKSKNKPEENTIVSADSLLDDKIFASALKWGDLPQCKQILDVSKKEECTITVENSLLLDKAIKTGDKKLCKKIELERYETFCKEFFMQRELDDKKLAEIKEEQLLAQKFAFEDNIEGCDEIEDENFQKQCKANILTERAIKFNDTKYCDELEKIQPEGKESCLDLINMDSTE